ASPGSAPIDLHDRCRLASSDGGASTVLGATLAQTACMIGSKIGTAVWPPGAPPPSVRRLPLALSEPTHTATVTSLVNPTNQASFSSSLVPVLPATYGARSAIDRAVPRCNTPCSKVLSW